MSIRPSATKLGDPPEYLVGLHPGHEGEDSRRHDAQLRRGPLVHGVNVLDGATRRVDGEVDAPLLQQTLEVQAELLVGAFLSAGDEAELGGGPRPVHREDAQQEDAEQSQNRESGGRTHSDAAPPMAFGVGLL